MTASHEALPRSSVAAGDAGRFDDLDEVLGVDSTVAARLVVSGTQRGEFARIAPTGRIFTVDRAMIAHVRDAKIAELREIVDGDSSRKQLERAAA